MRVPGERRVEILTVAALEEPGRQLLRLRVLLLVPDLDLLLRDPAVAVRVKRLLTPKRGLTEREV